MHGYASYVRLGEDRPRYVRLARLFLVSSG